jgi:hypothetical protein
MHLKWHVHRFVFRGSSWPCGQGGGLAVVRSPVRTLPPREYGGALVVWPQAGMPFPNLDGRIHQSLVLFLFSGFRGYHRPPALQSHGVEDNAPDANDEADFDIPYTQAVLERFMSNMSKLANDEYRSLSDLLYSLPDPSSNTTAKSISTAAEREKGVIPEADEDTLQVFSLSEMKLCKHATNHK